MFLLFKWLISAVAILIAAYIIPGVKVAGVWTALILAAVLGLLNISIKPLLILLTLPINILTLGLFTLVINALVIMLASSIVKGFSVGGFINALLFSIVLTIIQSLFQILIKK
ncbi:MAG: phage holin family protein [Candidatus Falkowbacteria bacterium]|nr:phage holin family protein [Candidatus Falkowbacteria bacterium]